MGFLAGSAPLVNAFFAVTVGVLLSAGWAVMPISVIWPSCCVSMAVFLQMFVYVAIFLGIVVLVHL